MSRLDRLLSLLETGSSAVTRKAAAVQLGEVQRLHPHEVHNLLKSVSKYLHSNSWETRIAAGLAVEAILKHVPQWKPIGTVDTDGHSSDINGNKLSFNNFDFDLIISKSVYLMGSEGKEYEHLENIDNSTEAIEKQKQALNSRLGLNLAVPLGFNPETLYTSEDLKEHVTENENTNKLGVGEVLGLSIREMNVARRKAKLALQRQRSRSSQQGDDQLDPPDKKKIKLENSETSGVQESPPLLPVPDDTGLWPPEVNEWPLAWFCENLCMDLFSPVWEVRHGAGTGLRHLMKTHGRSGGKSNTLPHNMMEHYHQTWLEDIALRLVSILIVDRFGDFVSDQVVAPVRETCAQALGSVTLYMTSNQVTELIKVLVKLMEQKEWETRHGGLLGIKYTFAVREELVEVLLPVCFEHVHRLLCDPVDDVGAVAGAALTLAVSHLTSKYPQAAAQTFQTLANHIPDLDDLTPAANTFVPLIVKLLNDQNISSQLSDSDKVEKLIRRIWSLMEHNNMSVRKAALETLCALPPQDITLLQLSLRHIYQRALVEHCPSILAVIKSVWCQLIDKSSLSNLLVAACPFMTNWLCLAMQPSRLPYDPSLLIRPKPVLKECKARNPCDPLLTEVKHCELKLYIGGNETLPLDMRMVNALDARYLTSLMLGYMSKIIVEQAPGVDYEQGNTESPISCYVNVLLVYLSSKSALQRFITALVIGEWACIAPPSPPPTLLVNKINECLNETIYYDEIGPSFTKLLQDTKDFLALLKHYQIPDIDHFLSQTVFTFDQMEKICDNSVSDLFNKAKLKPKLFETLEGRRKSLKSSINSTSSEFNALHIMTQAALAGSLLKLGHLPEKLGPLVKPLMESIKREENHNLQKLSASNLAELVEICIERNPSPNNKILTNLCTYLRSDPEFTPRISSNNTNTQSFVKSGRKDKMNEKNDKGMEKNKNADIISGIITLTKQQQKNEKMMLKKCGGVKRGPGRPPTRGLSMVKNLSVDDTKSQEDPMAKLYVTQRLGASLALTSIVTRFGADLPAKLPLLWKCITGLLLDTPAFSSTSHCDDISAEELVSLLQTLEITVPVLHETLFPIILSSFNKLVNLLWHSHQAVRHMSSRCVSALSQRNPSLVMPMVIKSVVPLLSVHDCVTKRQGAMEAITLLLDNMQLAIIPYITFLVIPIMGRMSDQDSSVRTLATHTFAKVIQLMPLDGPASRVSEDLLDLKGTEQTFLDQLFHPNTIKDYKVPVTINAELRSYQQSGVNWLYFLNKYKLHGILCDDMGLGKTIQSICILAGDHYDREQKYKKEHSAEYSPLPSLVVCPPTLTGHWYLEVSKFLSDKHLNPLQFTGTPIERRKLRSKVKYYNLIIASYDIVRNDIDFFSSIKWNYCILDEGHVIKNGKTKSTKAIKSLDANHRLILSGTPIQNNVLELWSLFDFLMPGFLGSEKQFNARYSKPILASREAKSTPKEQEAGVVAMEALHRQVLPFVLRRLKEDVLKELPPKITQDYYCELSPLQKRLYEDFSKSQAHQSLSGNIENSSSSHAHIFQALRYMQSVCNHPKLALTPKHPQYELILSELTAQNSSLSDINHAAKLPALKQLLHDCGIGVEGIGEDDGLVVNQHRALIFCQLNAMLDILEHDFLKVFMPSVSYLRLDRTVPSNTRINIVNLFNNDPSIDVLLLTTQVGGLGLNLTGADTVIFIEHDWSPMRDLQAMDRAYRIGQKKVVNVYRLITKGTLEEKIMGLQKFKLMTANTVISSENASLQTMGTDKLLDLFSKELKGDREEDRVEKPDGGIKSMLDSLQTMWEHDYNDEYDINHFLNCLKNQ